MEHNNSVKIHKKLITVIELTGFLSRVGCTITLKERDEFINYIAQHPESGTIISGAGGVRKIRWGNKNKGKSGGIRVIYYFYDEYAPIFLITAYGKGEQENLTNEQKKKIFTFAQILKTECKSNRSTHHD